MLKAISPRPLHAWVWDWDEAMEREYIELQFTSRVHKYSGSKEIGPPPPPMLQDSFLHKRQGYVSLVLRPHPSCISLPMLKVICAGVGFGSGTKTRLCTKYNVPVWVELHLEYITVHCVLQNNTLRDTILAGVHLEKLSRGDESLQLKSLGGGGGGR